MANSYHWISVTDQLPPIGQEVIVFVAPYDRHPKGYVTALCRCIRYEEDPDWWWDNSQGRNYHAMGSVSHWTPFPNPPA